jgi:hypothetical protein
LLYFFSSLCGIWRLCLTMCECARVSKLTVLHRVTAFVVNLIFRREGFLRVCQSSAKLAIAGFLKYGLTRSRNGVSILCISNLHLIFQLPQFIHLNQKRGTKPKFIRQRLFGINKTLNAHLFLFRYGSGQRRNQKFDLFCFLD